MAIPLIPWEPHVFPAEIQSELRRRSINRGLNYIGNAAAVWTDDDDDWNAYRGPMTSWVRVCSNGYGSDQVKKPGFVFYGGKDFYTGYGFNSGVSFENNAINESVIGYTPSGDPHVIENDLLNSPYPIHVPPPEIEKISATIQKELLRRVNIEWTCFSFKQLEYLTPYLLVPGISCIVEWGWNHFNPQSLLDLANEANLKYLFNNPYSLYTQNVLMSRGNYEVLFGIITNFEWSIDGNKIKCRTEVTSKDRIWAGQIINANMIENDSSVSDSEEKNSNTRVVDSLQKFVVGYADQFKDLISQGNKGGDAILDPYLNAPETDKEKFPLKAFFQYMKQTRPTDYKDYLFGLFFGRDEIVENIGSSVFTHKVGPPEANKKDDFDCQSPRSHFWMNMGLIVEIINFHSSQLKGMKDQPLFKVDVDDCVIGGHPNLISTDGNILLIPNALAPKYFFGSYGYSAEEKDQNYISTFTPSKISVKRPAFKDLNPNRTAPDLSYADYRVYKICLTYGGQVRRDDLNAQINRYRTAPRIKPDPGNRFEFPFATDFDDVTDGTVRTYSRYYTGLFKNLYFNVNAFKDLVRDSSVTTYKQLYEKIFEYINSAADDFWNFKLVASTGRQATTDLATMKVIDEKMSQYTSNTDGTPPFMFDYYNADGLLHAINFRPQLSNAQAIRTIYAQTNAYKKKKVVLSGHNELLDYMFEDRLFRSSDDSNNKGSTETFRDGSFKASMGKLQALKPPTNSFQMTVTGDKGPMVVRLTIPKDNAEVLSLMLDDADKAYNPRYLGIMPNIQAEFTIDGISGIRTFAMFRVRGLPEPYSEENIIFRVINVNDTVQNGTWVTSIVAGVIPLRGYLRSKLGLPKGPNINT